MYDDENYENGRRKKSAPTASGKLNLLTNTISKSLSPDITTKPIPRKAAVPLFRKINRDSSQNRSTVTSSLTSRSRASSNASAHIPSKPARDAFRGIIDKSVYQWRMLDFHAGEEVKRAEKMKRRESLIGRAKQAAVQRAVTAQMRQEEQERERSLFESAREDYHALMEYREEKRQAARESVAWRLKMWRHHRSVEEKQKQAELQKQAEMTAWVTLDWQEHDKYKKKLESEGRGNLASALDRWREKKKSMFVNPADQMSADGAMGREIDEKKDAYDDAAALTDTKRLSLLRTSLSRCEDMRLLESHQRAVESVHSEMALLKACTDEDEAMLSRIDEVEEDAEVKGRVSLMLRLESGWEMEENSQEHDEMEHDRDEGDAKEEEISFSDDASGELQDQGDVLQETSAQIVSSEIEDDILADEEIGENNINDCHDAADEVEDRNEEDKAFGDHVGSSEEPADDEPAEVSDSVDDDDDDDVIGNADESFESQPNILDSSLLADDVVSVIAERRCSIRDCFAEESESVREFKEVGEYDEVAVESVGKATRTSDWIGVEVDPSEIDFEEY